MIESLDQGTRTFADWAVSGYIHAAYAKSLAEIGTPVQLPRCQGWVLQRQIPGFDDFDAMGCYPLFCCQEWSQLSSDLDNLAGVVSIAIVTDPFGGFDVECLQESFQDVVVPFKQHFVVDLTRPVDDFAHPHHRRNARKALREVIVEECANPSEYLDDWTALYGTLVAKHDINGIVACSRATFAKQLRVPGIVAFRAVRDGTTVGMLLWYVQGHVVYYHLGAYSERGYELRASFALFHEAIEGFARRGLRWLNLGGGAGADHASGGLSRFKEGWSTGTRTAYLCGRILDRKRYDEITQAKNIPRTRYFPAYRFGEFS